MYIPLPFVYGVGIAIALIYILLAWAIFKVAIEQPEPSTSTTSILGSLDLGRSGGDTPSGYRPSTTVPPEPVGAGRYGRVTAEPLPDPSNLDAAQNNVYQHLSMKDEAGASLVVELEITGCSDPQMWYAKLIGQRVPYIRQDVTTKNYWSREPAGYCNIIRQEDAKVVRKESRHA